ncbi:MAG: acyl carrier protein [Saprospiraceae bacterium]
MEQKIIQYIIDKLHGGAKDLEINPEDDLLGSGLVESMGMMRLIQFIEDEFDIKIPPQDMTIENFMTVEAMAKYVEQTKVA